MAYIFLDESGDLGFNFKKKKTSKFFVVTCLFVENKKPFEKIVKKTHSELKKKYKTIAIIIKSKIKYWKKIHYFHKKQNLVRYLRATIRKPTYEDLLATNNITDREVHVNTLVVDNFY